MVCFGGFSLVSRCRRNDSAHYKQQKGSGLSSQWHATWIINRFHKFFDEMLFSRNNCEIQIIRCYDLRLARLLISLFSVSTTVDLCLCHTRSVYMRRIPKNYCTYVREHQNLQTQFAYQEAIALFDLLRIAIFHFCTSRVDLKSPQIL